MNFSDPVSERNMLLYIKIFFKYYTGIILKPGRNFQALLKDNHRLLYGFIAVSIGVILYTLVYVFLTIGGAAPSVFTPWLNIPKNEYYFYNQFILAPSIYICWILASGIAQLCSILVTGKGNYEDTLSVLGFGIGIATLASLIHDLPDALLGAVGLLDLQQYEIVLNSPTIWRFILLMLYSISAIWFVVLFSKGVMAVHHLKKMQSVIIGLFSYIIYQGFFIIFNR